MFFGDGFSLLALALTLSTATAAGVLSDGNSKLPACAQSCQLLNQAAAACSATTTADATTWNCFCQSGYLKALYSSDAGICDSACTSSTDSQQVSTWYKSNCGTDNGVSEHSGSGSNGAATTTAAAGGAATTASSGQTSSTSGTAAPTTSSTTTGTAATGPDIVTTAAQPQWWSKHWQYVVMIIVIAVGLGLFAIAGVLLKRHYERRQDRIQSGFNAGITDRRVSNNPFSSRSTYRGPENSSPTDGSFVNTMPYGYSDSRQASRTAGFDNFRGSGPDRNDTSYFEPEKDVAAANGRRQQRRVLVREHSSVESPASSHDSGVQQEKQLR